MSADIKDWLEQEAEAGWEGEFPSLLREAAAEIGRLRGEVDRQEASHGRTIDQRDRAYEMIDSVYAAVMDAHPEWSSAYGFADALNDIEDRIHAIKTATIAPAEAKGVAPSDGLLFDSQWVNIVNHDDCWRNWGKEDAVHEAVKMTLAAVRKNTPQPADGGAVACTVVGYLPGERAVEVRLRCEIPEWITNRHADDAWLSSHKPAAHHSACELGAVRGLVPEWLRLAAENRSLGMDASVFDKGLASAFEQCADNLTAALQHRGDSRGGEG